MAGKCYEEHEFVLTNKAGIHAEPAGNFANTAKKYKSEIQVKARGKVVDAKSILEFISLDLKCGEHFYVNIYGEDAEEAMEGISAIIERINSGEFSKMSGDIGFKPQYFSPEPVGFLKMYIKFLRDIKY